MRPADRQVAVGQARPAHVLEHVEDVFALAGLAEKEDGAALDDVDAMVDEGADGLVERKLARLPVEHGFEDVPDRP